MVFHQLRALPEAQRSGERGGGRTSRMQYLIRLPILSTGGVTKPVTSTSLYRTPSSPTWTSSSVAPACWGPSGTDERTRKVCKGAAGGGEEGRETEGDEVVVVQLMNVCDDAVCERS